MKSILSPVYVAKVFKALNKRRSLRYKINILYDTLRVADIMTTDSSAPKSRSKQAFKVKDLVPRFLYFIYLLRVSSPGVKRLTKLRKNNIKLIIITSTYRRTREDNLNTPLSSFTDRKII